jgi:7-keto-8-aminopelargonate synthetase-like enzyme
LKQASIKAIEEFGTNISGAVALSGYTVLHRDFERATEQLFAGFKSLMFTTSYLASLGAIQCIVGRGDLVAIDKLSHSSLFQAAQLSHASMRVFQHSDMQSLEAILRRHKAGRKLVVSDGVFSVDGDIAPVAVLSELCARHGALLYIDDAHGVGMLGDTGKGVIEESNCLPDFLLGTMSKAFGSSGGFLLIRNEETHRAMRHFCPTYASSRASAPGVVGASICALGLNELEGRERRNHLLSLSRRFAKRLRDSGVDVGDTSTPIIPISFNDPCKATRVAKQLLDCGILTAPFIPPFVPKGWSRLRISVTWHHSLSDVEEVAEAIIKAL